MTDAHDAKAREISYRLTMLSQKAWVPAEGDQIIAAALRDCERETIERAAKVAEGYGKDYLVVASLEIAASIRALGTQDTTGGE